MTDLEMFRSMLKARRIGHEVHQRTDTRTIRNYDAEVPPGETVELIEGHANVGGYSDFRVEFYFDAEEKLLCVGVWE